MYREYNLVMSKKKRKVILDVIRTFRVEGSMRKGETCQKVCCQQLFITFITIVGKLQTHCVMIFYVTRISCQTNSEFQGVLKKVNMSENRIRSFELD